MQIKKHNKHTEALYIYCKIFSFYAEVLIFIYVCYLCLVLQ